MCTSSVDFQVQLSKVEAQFHEKLNYLRHPHSSSLRKNKAMDLLICLWLSKTIGKIQHEIIHWTIALCCCRCHCYPAMQEKNSSITLTWRAGRSSALPNPRRSQLDHLNCTKCCFCLIHPEASIPLRAGCDEVATSCNFCTMPYLYYTFHLHRTLILPIPVAHAVGILLAT